MTKGFSIYEFVMALAIFVFLAAGILAALSAFRNTQDLDRAANDVLTALREARERTLSSEGGSQFGVFVDASRAVVFPGTTYIEGGAGNKIFSFSPRVEAYSITLPGGIVTFERLTGAASASGTVSVRLKADTTKIRAVSVNSNGLVYAQ